MAMGQVAEPGVHGGATGLVLPVAMVFVGCCLNSMTLEMIVREDPGSGTLITVTQFAFVAFEGILLKSIRGVGVARTVPLKHYFGMVAIFFAVSVANNVALGFKISMPLHMIFRSGSLITNLILGVVVMGKRHSTIKFLSVALVTAGIILCTWISGKRDDVKPAEVVDADALAYVVGLSILSFSLVASSFLGLYQEYVYKKYGRNWREGMFYSHALALPCFVVFWSDIAQHAAIFSQSEPSTAAFSFGLPRLWIILVANVVTQYLCIRGVFTLTSLSSSLTVTLLITLRKFVSLVISIFYFRNPFTAQHWLGAILVFGGTLLFFDQIPSAIARTLRHLSSFQRKGAVSSPTKAKSQ